MSFLEERLVEDISYLLHGRPEERAYCVKAIKDRFQQLGDENFEELDKHIQQDLNSILIHLPSRRKKCVQKISKTFTSIRFLRVFGKLTLCPNTGGYHGYLTKGEIQLLYDMKIVRYPEVPTVQKDWFYFIPHKRLDHYIGQ